MGYYKHQPVVVVPAASLAQFNAILQRNGYGPQNMTVAVVGKTEKVSTAAATHYVLECVADDGLLAAINLALATIGKTGTTVEVFSKATESKVDAVLAKANLQTKSKLSADVVPAEVNVTPKEA